MEINNNKKSYHQIIEKIQYVFQNAFKAIAKQMLTLKKCSLLASNVVVVLKAKQWRATADRIC